MQSANGAQFLNSTPLFLSSASLAASLVAGYPALSAPVIVMITLTGIYASLRLTLTL